MKENFIAVGIVLVIAMSGYLVFKAGERAVSLGGALAGSEAKIATSTTSNLGAAGATALFSTSTGCTSRIITTTPIAPIRLTFRDDDVPTATFGHIQAASTSVAYDSAIYGCGRWEAFSWVAQAVSISETVGK